MSVCWAGEACARVWKSSAETEQPTGARTHLHTGFCGPKRSPKKSGLTLSRGQARELAPVITAGHCYRDGDDEASTSNLSPAHDAHPRGRSGTPGGESLCVSHPPAPRGAPAQGSRQDPGGQYLPSPPEILRCAVRLGLSSGRGPHGAEMRGPWAHSPGG